MFSLAHFGEVTANGIAVKLLPEDRPTFRREYTAKVTRDDGSVIQMTVTMRTSSWGDRYDMSELRQGNGNWVMFDLKRPAEKILDRSIIGQVEALCREIQQLDHDFLASKPASYVDNTNTTWTRA